MFTSVYTSQVGRTPSKIVCPMKTKRKVEFDSSVQVIEIATIQRDEEEAIWYSTDEMEKMKLGAFKAFQGRKHLERYCIYGNAFDKERRDEVRQSIANVILQQELLWDDGLEDPELIAEIYTEDVGTAQSEAHQRGILHAKHVAKLVTNYKNAISENATVRSAKNVHHIYGLETPQHRDSKKRRIEMTKISHTSSSESLPPHQKQDEVNQQRPSVCLRTRMYHGLLDYAVKLTSPKTKSKRPLPRLTQQCDQNSRPKARN